MALPVMSKFIRGRALGSESARMLALMHAAQSRAVSEGMPMMFWIDAQQNGYGVAAETSGQNGDPKAEDLLADDTLKIAVVNSGAGAQTTFKNLPAIKFLPDGTVDEGSPQSVQLTDGDGFARWLTELKSRTGYEINDHAN
jgi:Tfp pilus assembly protein FimT